VVHRGELNSDSAAADDDDVLRQRVGCEDLVGRDDALAVHLETGQRLDARTRRDDDVVRLEKAVPACAGRAVFAGLADPDLRRALQATATRDPRDLVLVDQRFHAGPEALDDLVTASRHLDEVHLGLAGQLQAEVLGVADALSEGGRLEKGLGRDAAAVEARPADLVLVDERHLEPELGRPERGGVAARAGAEDDEVEGVGRADGHAVRCLGWAAARARPAAGRASGSSVASYAARL
jgi:hypothetical protein